MRHKHVLWILLLTLNSTVIAAPSGKWYQVEVLIFEQPTTNRPDESVPLIPGRPSLRHAVDLRPFNPENQQDSFVIAPETQWTLLDSRRRLSKTIFHVRWRQWITGQSTSIPIHLFG